MTANRVNEIDLLRFLAALSVVFFHYAFRGFAADGMSVMPYPALAPVAKYGYLGVELFFMISGFVILMTASSGTVTRFAISRAVRLYPAFWACSTLTFLFTLAIGAPRYSASFKQYLWNLTLLGEFFDVEPIDGSYWSLFVEIRFYLLVAIVMVVGRIHRSEPLLLLWLAISVACEIHPSWRVRYWLVTDYSAFFIAGATFFLVRIHGLSVLRTALLVGAWGLANMVSIKRLDLYEGHYHAAFSPLVVSITITLFFAAFTLVALRRTGWVGERRWLVAGMLTYPLYLLHQQIGFMVFNLEYPQLNAHLLFWGGIAAALGGAYLVHMHVERRIAPWLQSALDALAHRVRQVVGRSPTSA